MSIIELKNVTKLYKNKRGIRNVTLSVEKGDILGLLGPNGSGKTTIMKAVLGLIRVRGSVRVFGTEPEENFEHIMSRTGALIETPAIYKDMTAAQNLRIRASLYPSVTEEKINSSLEAVELTRYKNDKAGRFSLGMKQRLGLASALLTDPELVILDEPVNGLDIEGVVGIRELIQRLNRERGVTFLISSHMASEIEKTCGKVAVMYDGEIAAVNTTKEALRLHPSMEEYFLSVVNSRRGGTVI